MVGVEQGGLHVNANRRTQRYASRSRQKAGNPVQAFLDVGVVLKRREHWRWESNNPEYPGNGNWTMRVNPEITRWLKQRNMVYKKYALRIKKRPGVQQGTDVILFFTSTKDARYFASVWNVAAISDAEIRRRLGAEGSYAHSSYQV